MVVVDLLFCARHWLSPGTHLRRDHLPDLLSAHAKTWMEVRHRGDSPRHARSFACLAPDSGRWHSRALYRRNEFARIGSWRHLPDRFPGIHTADVSFALLDFNR